MADEPSPPRVIEQDAQQRAKVSGADRTYEPTTLTHRARLTFFSTALQQAITLGLGFIVTRVMLRDLGTQLFGAWVIIGQAMSYMSLSDFRPMGTLKFTLAVRQHVDDVHEKRRQVGAAIRVWAATFPVILGVGAAITWLAPSLIKTSSSLHATVRLTVAFAAASVALDGILSLPLNVVRAVNLDYKAVWIYVGTILGVGGTSLLAIWLGWGLPGVAATNIGVIAIAAVFRLRLARREVPWFGSERPKKGELRRFTSTTGWLFASGLSRLLFDESDLLLIGATLGAATTAMYATTGYVLTVAFGQVALQLLSSGSPGISDLAGREEWARLERVRGDLLLLVLGTLGVFGVPVLLLNRSFISLWVGPGLFAGFAVNGLLVIMALQSMLFHVESVVADSMLLFRPKSIVTAISGIIAVAAAWALEGPLGLEGVVIGLLLGRLVISAYLPIHISRRTMRPVLGYLRGSYRTILVVGAMLGVSAAVAPSVAVHGWIALIGAAAGTAALSSGVMWLIAFPREARGRIAERLVGSWRLRTGVA